MTSPSSSSRGKNLSGKKIESLKNKKRKKWVPKGLLKPRKRTLVGQKVGKDLPYVSDDMICMFFASQGSLCPQHGLGPQYDNARADGNVKRWGPLRGL